MQKLQHFEADLKLFEDTFCPPWHFGVKIADYIYLPQMYTAISCADGVHSRQSCKVQFCDTVVLQQVTLVLGTHKTFSGMTHVTPRDI